MIDGTLDFENCLKSPAHFIPRTIQIRVTQASSLYLRLMVRLSIGGCLQQNKFFRKKRLIIDNG